ncbi:MAG: hypothetical protein JWO57_4202 [Pseudonocardiales bacterium]|nr:hypothetical protein [Pseudonocardiales bacterium]
MRWPVVCNIGNTGDISQTAWNTSGMSYVRGSQAESMIFSDEGIEYGPAGLAHVVDTESALNGRNAAVGYAVCGEAVLIWQQPFDPNLPDVHDACAAVAATERRQADSIAQPAFPRR